MNFGTFTIGQLFETMVTLEIKMEVVEISILKYLWNKCKLCSLNFRCNMIWIQRTWTGTLNSSIFSVFWKHTHYFPSIFGSKPATSRNAIFVCKWFFRNDQGKKIEKSDGPDYLGGEAAWKMVTGIWFHFWETENLEGKKYRR